MPSIIYQFKVSVFVHIPRKEKLGFLAFLGGVIFSEVEIGFQKLQNFPVVKVLMISCIQEILNPRCAKSIHLISLKFLGGVYLVMPLQYPEVDSVYSNFISAFTQSRGPMLTVDRLKGYTSTIKTLTSRRLRVHEIQWRPSSKFSC